MPKRMMQFSASMLTLLLIMGATAPAASVLDSCRPKACCHAGNGAPKADAMGHSTAASRCHGQPLPCCEVQPTLPFPDMALMASPEAPYQKMTDIIGTIDISAPVMFQCYCPAPYYKVGHLKIPQPPIYLQIQSFLC